MLPFLVYLDTVVYVPHYITLVAIFYAIIKKPYFERWELSNPVFLTILLIVLLSVLNFTIHYATGLNRSETIPYTILMIGCYLVATRLSDRDLTILIYLVVVECLFAYLEFFLGIKTFFTGLENYAAVDNSDFLYFRSVFGLSENSSDLAVKILFAYFLIFYKNLTGKKSIVFKVILLIALVMSFNRSAILTVVFFHAIRFLSLFWRSAIQFMTLKLGRSLLYAFLTGILGIMIVFVLVLKNFDVIIDQLTRGTHALDLSGRNQIWAEYFRFIRDHLWLGNGSFKYYVVSHGKQAHGHNSFLQILATHGLIIFLVHMLLIFLSFRVSSWIFILSILVFSMAQYGIFWGMSFADVLFLVFLIDKRGFTERPSLAPALPS